jgi:TRAP-type C4-dicarboxylate transport system substrate-binding protein
MKHPAARAMFLSVILIVVPPLRQPRAASSPGIVAASTGDKQTVQFRQWQAFRKNVDDQSDGSLLLDYMLYGELGSSVSMLQTVINGHAAITGVGCAGITSIVPELAIPQMPYLFNSDDEYDFVFSKYMTPIFSEILAKQGVVLLQWSDMGWMNLYARAPGADPAQMENKSVRTINNIVGPALLNAVKAVPVDVPVGNLVSTQQADKLFGTFGLLRTYARVQSAFKYITLTQHSHNCGMVVANKAWFQSLTPQEQIILKTSYPALYDFKKDVADEAKALLAKATASGATVVSLTPAQRNAWAAASLPLYPGIIEQAGGRSAEVYDKIKAGKQAFLRDPASSPVH